MFYMNYKQIVLILSIIFCSLAILLLMYLIRIRIKIKDSHVYNNIYNSERRS